MKLDHLLMPHTRTNSKWIKDLNVRPENVKILEKIGSTISDIAHSSIFFRYISSDKGNKRKINKWDYTKLKKFCTTKETINKIKTTH